MDLRLPAAAHAAWWLTSCLRGHVGPDDLLDALAEPDTVQVVHEAGGSDSPQPLLELLALARRAGVDGAGLALPVEGDLLGLGGPTAFNAAAVEAGQALVLGTTGVVPHDDGGQRVWTVHPAARRQLPDVHEADQALRGALLRAANDLAALDVARWRPDVADELTHLGATLDLAAPPGVPARCQELAARSVRCSAVVALALVDDGGAVTATEAAARREVLAPLDRAARRGLVAACSAEVWPPA